ncbi:hypothetical protein HD553DRAFT_342107 [Filobasidium floriforme]|uniref:uncharacterized protein n=1 Tax=Filobasidium floriforme TaxID=5210 RepID=UPI001E8CEAB2|nr:uncharacterized protein HD553DRAFT_342107 [Filobasidium floriforme]KAH8084617.1 hypothetical protein HD553DRAFT_342107 [Filobasidium floriforme]
MSAHRLGKILSADRRDEQDNREARFVKTWTEKHKHDLSTLEYFKMPKCKTTKESSGTRRTPPVTRSSGKANSSASTSTPASVTRSAQTATPSAAKRATGAAPKQEIKQEVKHEVKRSPRKRNPYLSRAELAWEAGAYEPPSPSKKRKQDDPTGEYKLRERKDHR